MKSPFSVLLLLVALAAACGGASPPTSPTTGNGGPDTGLTMLGALNVALPRIRAQLGDPVLETAGSLTLSLGGRLTQGGEWVFVFLYSNLERRQTVRLSADGSLSFEIPSSVRNPVLVLGTGSLLDTDQAAGIALDAGLRACIEANSSRSGWRLDMDISNRGDDVFNRVDLRDSRREIYDSVFINQRLGTTQPLGPGCRRD